MLDRTSEGTLSWNEQVRASLYAEEVPGSQIGFAQGERFTVRELFEAMTIHSANDAAVALAEHISGSEEQFVKLMNSRAAGIGLSEQTIFGNATGLSRDDIRPFPAAASERDTRMTAKDTALLAGYLLKKYPEILDVTSRGSITLASGVKKLPSTNLMLSNKPFAYRGNDGLKTGYTLQAGYCFTGTAKQDGRRLISVIMGASTPALRFAETEQLFSFGFQLSGLESVLAHIESKFGIVIG